MIYTITSMPSVVSNYNPIDETSVDISSAAYSYKRYQTFPPINVNKLKQLTSYAGLVKLDKFYIPGEELPFSRNIIDISSLSYTGVQTLAKKYTTRNELEFVISPNFDVNFTINTVTPKSTYDTIETIYLVLRPFVFTLKELENVTPTGFNNEWMEHLDFRTHYDTTHGGKSVLSVLYESYPNILGTSIIAIYKSTSSNLSDGGYESKWYSIDQYDSIMSAYAGSYSYGILHIAPIYNKILTSGYNSLAAWNSAFINILPQLWAKSLDYYGKTFEFKIIAGVISYNIKTLMTSPTKTYTNSTWNTTKTWYIKVTFSMNSRGTYLNNNSNVVNYVTTWGTTEAQNTANQFSSKTFTLTADNYTQYKTLLTAAANTEITACQAMLDIPDLVLPANHSENYTKNGFTYTLSVQYSKGSAKNQVVVKSLVDGGAFGTNSTLTYTTQALANSGLATEQSNRITAMKTACNNSPANTSKTYTKNGLNFTIATTFTKAAGNTTCTIKCLLDGTQYSSATQAVTAANATNLTACSTSSTNQITALENILKNAPANTSETYSKGNMHFTVTKTFSKSAGNTTATWVVNCDGVQFGTGTQTIGASDPGANMTTLNTTATNSLNSLKTNIDGCPADSSEVITVHGFKYNLGVFYTKTAGTTKATGGAKLDGNIYGSTESTFSVSTWAANKTTLTNNAANHKASCRAVIDTSPNNSSATYTVNGLSYNVGTTYSKAAGNSTATITTTLDGIQQKSNTQSVSVNDLANNISACSSKARTDLDALKAILDQSPADYDQTQYTISGFPYTAGATFTKTINSGNVTVNIYCDGEVDETYTATVDATSTANDIAALKANAKDKVDTLVASLEGLEADTVNHVVNGFNFVLLSQYTKNYSTKKITINNFIDGVPYGTPYQADFDRTKISDYRTEGLNRIEAMKTAVGNAPANTSAKHTVNGFNFTIGTQYEKALGSTTVYVKTMLDGVQTGTSSTVTYDVTNVAAITSQGSSDLAALRVALNACPANYANTHTKSGMGWRTGVNFSKTEDDPSVRLIATLDGEEYGNAVNMDFDVTNISALSTKAAEMESNLNTTLTNVSPADTAENFTIRRFNFNIESCFVKTPGIKTVTTMVKLDGTQYDSYHQEDFNVNTATGLSTYNNNLINTLKSRLTSVCPDDIHTTYSRNQFNFVIDAYFSKQPNTDVIDIEYNIDSADLVTSN